MSRIIERHSPWRCIRHALPEETLSPSAPERCAVLTLSRIPGAPGLYWIQEGAASGSGLASGYGFRAFAEDWPEGTRLLVTARIEVAR